MEKSVSKLKIDPEVAPLLPQEIKDLEEGKYQIVKLSQKDEKAFTFIEVGRKMEGQPHFESAGEGQFYLLFMASRGFTHLQTSLIKKLSLVGENFVVIETLNSFYKLSRVKDEE